MSASPLDTLKGLWGGELPSAAAGFGGSSDPPLEEHGFELSVPLRWCDGSRPLRSTFFGRTFPRKDRRILRERPTFRIPVAPPRGLSLRVVCHERRMSCVRRATVREMKEGGLVKFTFWTPGWVASRSEILEVSDRQSRPDFALQLFNLTTPLKHVSPFRHRVNRVGVSTI